MKREDTPEEAAFRQEVRTWLDANAELRKGEGDWSNGPVDHSVEAEAEYFEKSRAWQAKLAEGGWAALTWAPEHGGRNATPAQAMIFAEEAARYDCTNGYISAPISLVGPSLIHFGTKEQQERYLKPMLSGEEIWCQLFSEPEAGSDLAGLRCRAVLDGDEFVVNGQKLWTTSAQYADYGFLLARTNVDVPKHDGISFLLIDMRQPGIEVRPLVTMKQDRHFNEVFFSDARVPKENVVNGVDRGWDVAKFVLMNEGAMIGTGGGRTPSTAVLAQQAKESGRFDDAGVRQRLGEAFVRERVLELLQDRLKDAILDGRRPDVDGSVLKILTAEWGHAKAEMALSLQGAHALLDGPDAIGRGTWQTSLLGKSAISVGGGTSEVHRNGLGERTLRLPREPRLDRDQPFKELKTSG